MREILDNRFVILTLRIFIAGVFLWAAIPKLNDPAAFAKSVNNYHLLPGSAVNLWALFLPALEALSALGVLSGMWGRASAWLVNGMLALFLVAIGLAIQKGVNIDCGCFTQNPTVKSSMALALLRDVGFLLAAAPLLLTRAKGLGWK